MIHSGLVKLKIGQVKNFGKALTFLLIMHIRNQSRIERIINKHTMRNKLILFSITFMIGAFAYSQKSMQALIAENMQLARSQYKILAATTPADSMPRHYDSTNNKLVNSDTK